MPRDYYRDLEINRGASQSDIARAYRKLTLRWHPKHQQEGEQVYTDLKTVQYFFNQISEAYEVLSDPIKRAFYDNFGEEKLKSGFFSQGDLKGGYRYKNNAEEIYEYFYSQTNPFAQIFDSTGKEVEGSMFGDAYGNINYKKPKTLQNVNVEVFCTLNELYVGCFKEVEFEKVALNKDRITTSVVKQRKTLEINPGYKDGNEIIYNEQGNESNGEKSSDLIFIIRELPHSTYKRKNNDLHKTETITIVDSLKCTPINVLSLDQRVILVPVDQILNQKSTIVVKGEGMPVHGKQKKGNLVLNFNVIFPKQIDFKQRQNILQLLE